MPRISDFPVRSAPSASAHVAGVDVNENGELINVQIPFSTFGAYKSYSYTVTHSGTNMFELITDLKSKGYTAGEARQPMVLTLHGALGDRIFAGYIYSLAGDNVCNFELLDCARCTKYSQTAEGVNTTTPISTALNNATVTEFGESSSESGGLPYESVYWGNPMTDMLDKITGVITPNVAQRTIIQLYGYGAALLLADGSTATEGDKDVWKLWVTNLYDGKMYEISDWVDPATITISDFLNSGEYEVKQESSGSPMTSITYDELKALRDSGSLVPGMFYRITDYVCTTAQENTGAMTNQFDIIVQALDESTLSETASADHHDVDIYFRDTNFGAWELRYCLDNDSSRFAWALDNKQSIEVINHLSQNAPYGSVLERFPDMDYNCGLDGYTYAWATAENKYSYDSTLYIYTMDEEVHPGRAYAAYMASNEDWLTGFLTATNCNITTTRGKGVVYYMKDEFGNECPYDFKNITYKGDSIHKYDEVGLNAGTYYPTFTLTSLLSYTQWGATYGVSRDSSLDTTIDGVTYYGYACSSTPSAWGGNTFYVTDTEISSSSTMYRIYEDNSISTVNFGGALSVGTSLDNSSKSHGNIIKSSPTEYGASLPYVVFVGMCEGNTVECGATHITFTDSCYHNFANKGCCNIYFSRSRGGIVGSYIYDKVCFGAENGESEESTSAINYYNIAASYFSDLVLALESNAYVWDTPMFIQLNGNKLVGQVNRVTFGGTGLYTFSFQHIGEFIRHKGQVNFGAEDSTDVNEYVFGESCTTDLEARIAALEGN